MSIIVERHYSTTARKDTETFKRERGQLHSRSHADCQLFEGRCLPEMREAPGKVDNQVEADQIFVVGGVSPNVNGELAYVAISQTTSMDI